MTEVVSPVTVRLSIKDAISTQNDAAFEFLCRQKLRAAGIPLGPWGTSTVTRGVLSWWDDCSTGERVIEWRP